MQLIFVAQMVNTRVTKISWPSSSLRDFYLYLVDYLDIFSSHFLGSLTMYCKFTFSLLHHQAENVKA